MKKRKSRVAVVLLECPILLLHCSVAFEKVNYFAVCYVGFGLLRRSYFCNPNLVGWHLPGNLGFDVAALLFV